MTTTLNNNGSQRKTLAAQIDRLDHMLDGLADGLNEAVRDAVILAVQQAVSAVLTEMLTNPALLAKLHATTNLAPVSPTNAAAPSSLGQQLIAGKDWVGKQLGQFMQGCRNTWARLGTAVRGWSSRLALAGLLALFVVKQKVQRAPQLLQPLWRYKFQIGAALIVATASGVAGFYAGPSLSAVSSGVCGFVVTLAAQARGRVRHFLTADSPSA